jgi:CheY-like chemotaxis protein
MTHYNNLLLIEDDNEDQLLFILAVKAVDPSLHCTVALDGMEAIEMLPALSPVPDLIFLDINMPRMNGFEFLAWIKAQEVYKNIPVIVLTTNAGLMERCAQAGAAVYCHKPFTLSTMKKLVLSILSHDVIKDAKAVQALVAASQ